MTRSQFSHAVGADEKWIENSIRLLGRTLQNSAEEARWMRLLRILTKELGMPLSRAAQVADKAMELPADAGTVEIEKHESGTVTLVIDMARLNSSHAAALSAALNLVEARRRGRPARRTLARAGGSMQASRPPADLAAVRLQRLEEYSPILRTLADAAAQFVVIGGLAAAAHGSRRVTSGLDICYEALRPNMKLLAQILRKAKAQPRGLESDQILIMDRRQLVATPVMALTTRKGPIAMLDTVKGIGDYSDCLRRSIEIDAFGVRFRVLDLDAVIESKRACGRPKDIEHLPELEELLGPGRA